MGADLLLAPLWSKPDVPLDWDAGLTAARSLSAQAVERLREFAPFLDDADDDADLHLRAVDHAVASVETMREHFDGSSRVLASFSTPGHDWWLWITGGMSWGDSPNDLWEAIEQLWAVPEVLAAIGFHVPPTDDELETP